MLSVYVEFDRSVGTEYVAYSAEVAFGQVYVDFGFVGLFSLSFREFLGLDCFFWARQAADLAAGAPVFVEVEFIILDMKCPF